MHLIFSPESHDAAADTLRQWKGCVFTVRPTAGDAFDGELQSVTANEDGFYVATFAVWDEATGESDPNDLRTFDIYEGMQSLELI